MIRTGFSAAIAALLLPLPAGCNSAKPVVSSSEKQADTEQSILERSSPADGASVEDSLDRIELWFDPPARLIELTVTGPDNLTMPMMITAAGETGFYSVPLTGVSAGRHSVSWRATAGGQSQKGSFEFTVQ